MSTWEKIFVNQIKSLAYKNLDLDETAECVLVAIGSSPTFLLKNLNKAKNNDIITTGYFDGTKVSVAKCRAGSIAVEELIHILSFTKAKYVVSVGATGGLQDRTRIGDIIIPTKAERGEGLTQYYYPKEIPASPDSEILSSLIHRAKAYRTRFHVGKIYTSGTLLHETDEMIQLWSRQGCISVDCETSAFFMLCRYCGLKSGSVLYVSDEPLRKLPFSSNKELTKKWIEAQQVAAQIALEGVVSCFRNLSDADEHN